jgi:signal transduction histidine kinase
LRWGFSPGRLFFTGSATGDIRIIVCRRFAPKNSLHLRSDNQHNQTPAIPLSKTMSKMESGMNRPKNEDAFFRAPAPEEEKNWVGRWRQPTGSRAVVFSLLVFALIVVVGGLVYATGGTGFAWVHLMYLPIILATAGFGIYGGIAAALVAGFVLGPYMPLDAAKGLSQATSNWMLRTGFFLLVGAFSGLISQFLNGQIDRLKETHQNLIRSHEELKNAQLKLIQTAKLESIGRLAAGVAHEVKNPLAVIQLGIDYLTQTVKDTANRDCIETIQEMDDAVRRADAVIKGLLDFSRSEQLSLSLIDLNSVIEESLLLVKHELTRNHISLEKHLAEPLPPIELDRNKIKQVFINVFMNAIHAMGNNGDLSVRTVISRPAVAADASQTLAGRNIVVEIEDSGTGIPDDKLDKLFDPFFTTKPVGAGTGLGLSVSRNIIELHRATIKIANRKGIRGASVTISFPIPDKVQTRIDYD